ncbi:chitinase CLP-like [Rutidosis leptorrhynchoides]|uniref:chitinase CLP-like n=1 Tax=Rutidosis leptorrhynchoides TaxID=125765 RepID=UPI003A9A5B06
MLKLLVIILAFISHEHEAIAEYVPPYSSVVIPVTKHTDVAKPLYSVEIMTSFVNKQFRTENSLIDIDAPFIWHNCIVYWHMYPGKCPNNRLCHYPVSCEDQTCTWVRTNYSYKNPLCSPETNWSGLPSYAVDCTCPLNVVNPVTGTCGGPALLNEDTFTVNTSNGRNVFDWTYNAYPNAACAPSSSYASFPANVTGIMAFSTSLYALPEHLYKPLKKSLSLCLPSTSFARGVMFFGTGPYYLLPHSNVDLTSYLSYTPLLKHPDSFGYFIDVKSIVIKSRFVEIPPNTTTKLSTIDAYTTRRTDIYNSVVRRFSKVTRRLQPAEPVAPFGYCFSTSNNNNMRNTGLKVPYIDFVLQGEKKWTISTSNSIKQVTKDVACLAFVDGGATSEPAIVIGTFMFEDNFVVFDLENSTFGFSSSLLHKNTSCSNFNFTLTHLP